MNLSSVPLSDPYTPSVGVGFVMVQDDQSDASSSHKHQKDERKIYGRKYKEEMDTEDIKVSMFRRKKVGISILKVIIDC